MILLLIAFMRMYKIKGDGLFLGTILMEFLEFYGRVFDFSKFAIDVNKSTPFEFYQEETFDGKAMIYDPLTYINVSTATYRLGEIKSLFSEALEIINHIKSESVEYDSHLIDCLLQSFS